MIWSPFHLTDSTGSPKDWTPGKVTVISFCAYWCDTWKQQVPRLVAARSATAGLPVAFITVSVDGRWSEVSNHNQGLALWLDRGGAWSRGQGVDRVPTTVVIDTAGEVRFASGAVIRTTDIVDAVHGALARKPSGGSLFLTFDDFPPQRGGEEMLDSLRALGIHATLFCMGDRVASQSALLKRALREGHSLQIHSWDHNASDPQLVRCKAAFRSALGFEPSLYRAPGSEVISGEKAHHRIVDPYDFQRPKRNELLRRVLSAVCPGAVIQLHAGVDVTLEALSEMTEGLRQRGFSFEVLGTR